MTTSAEQAPERAPTSRTNRRALIGLGLGQTLEFYDWTIFGLLASYIGPQFFAPGDPVAATLSALAVFAVGFAARPIGGILLGSAADRIGRRAIMMVAITLMAVTTLIIAVTPTYAQIGVWAAVVLVVCRLLQGVSAGIEAPLGTIYAVELSPQGREGRAAGLMASYVYVGTLLASFVSFLAIAVLGAAVMNDWGWRIPFVVGGLLGLVVLYIRRTLPESLTEADRGAAAARQQTAWAGVRRHWVGVLAVIFVVGAAQAFYYAWAVGLPNLARTFGEDPTTIFLIASVSGLMLALGCLPVGRLIDRFRLSRVGTASRLLIVPTAFLMLFYSAPGVVGFALVMLGGSVVLLINMATYNVTATSLMPKYCRGTGVSLGYSVAAALFGGTASYVLVWTQSKQILWFFPTYLAVLAVLSVIAYALARRRSGTFAGE